MNGWKQAGVGADRPIKCSPRPLPDTPIDIKGRARKTGHASLRDDSARISSANHLSAWMVGWFVFVDQTGILDDLTGLIGCLKTDRGVGALAMTALARSLEGEKPALCKRRLFPRRRVLLRLSTPLVFRSRSRQYISSPQPSGAFRVRRSYQTCPQLHVSFHRQWRCGERL